MSDIKSILTKRFIDLEVGKYYRFFHSGKYMYCSGRIGRVDSIHNDHCTLDGPRRGEQVSRTFAITTPNPSSPHRFLTYNWDHGYGMCLIYKEGTAPTSQEYKMVDGIQYVEELNIKSDEDYYKYIGRSNQ